jgi:hypothetical protein
VAAARLTSVRPGRVHKIFTVLGSTFVAAIIVDVLETDVKSLEISAQYYHFYHWHLEARFQNTQQHNNRALFSLSL